MLGGSFLGGQTRTKHSNSITSVLSSEVARDFVRHEYMTKQGAVVKNWKKRYFSLNPQNNHIAYFKKAADCLEKKKPLGYISLEDARARRNIDDPKKPHMMEIYYPKFPKKRVYKILAKSDHAANCWVDTINQLTIQDRTSVSFLNPFLPSSTQNAEMHLEISSDGSTSPRSPRSLSTSSSFSPSSSFSSTSPRSLSTSSSYTSPRSLSTSSSSPSSGIYDVK